MAEPDRPLRARVADFLAIAGRELHAAAPEPLATSLAETRRDIEGPPALFAERPAKRLPGVRHLPRALDAARQGPPGTAAIARSLDDLVADMVWIQNPNYTADNLGADYLANSAYSDILGPRGLADHPRLAIGALLLGPGLHYPDHHHPAEEIYLVLAGEAQWRQAEAPWRPLPPGSLIHHPPNTLHATMTGRDPLLALYLWRGALNVPAKLKS